MESFLGRYRNLTILVGVLFLQLLGLAVQVKRAGAGDPENTRLIRIWAVDAITPFERGLVWVQASWADLWHNYFYLRGVRAENRELKQEIQQMRLEQVRLNEDAEQAHRLQKLLAFKEQVIGKPLPAQVIGTSGSDLSQCIYIDKGSDDGIKADMAVITANGIVGKVLHAYPTTSQVLMINDQTSGVGAMLEKSRLQGVLKGTPEGSIVLERVMSDEKVSPGDAVISSGGDQIFPKGLPVGTVTKVSPGHEMFLNIQVKPAADLNRLEEVLVVTEKQDRDVAAENTGRARAADILAERLPSVPDKPTEAASKESAAAKPATAPTAQASVKPQGAAVTPVKLAKPESSERSAATSGEITATAGKTGATNGNAVRAVSIPATPVSSPPSSSQPKKVAPITSPSGAELSGGTAKTVGSTTPARNTAASPKPATQPAISAPPPTEDGPH